MIVRLEYRGDQTLMLSAEDNRPIHPLRVIHVGAGGVDLEQTLLEIGARNETVNPIGWRPDAGCPPGEYVCNAPLSNSGDELVSMGPWFIPVLNVEGHTGIGIHGGGSCKGANGSQGALQGWCPTENCFRTQNEWLRELVALLQQAQSPYRYTVIQGGT